MGFRTLDKKSHKSRVSFLIPNDFLLNARDAHQSGASCSASMAFRPLQRALAPAQRRQGTPRGTMKVLAALWVWAFKASLARAAVCHKAGAPTARESRALPPLLASCNSGASQRTMTVTTATSTLPGLRRVALRAKD